MQIILDASEEIVAMFQLSSLLSGVDQNELFEQMVRNYSSDIIKGRNKEKNQDSEQSASVNLSNAEELYKKTIQPKSYTSYQNKALQRIRLWARKPNQINHQCIRAFLECEQNGEASYAEMLNYFISNTKYSRYQFNINMTSMTTDAGNSHGRVFEIIGDSVILVNEVKGELNKYINNFVKPLSI